jgi:hypothetical protein
MVQVVEHLNSNPSPTTDKKGKEKKKTPLPPSMSLRDNHYTANAG